MSSDLEFLKQLFLDPRSHNSIGVVNSLGLSNDGSVLRVGITILPSERGVIAEMTFSDVNDVTFPELNDLALISFAEGEAEECFVMKLVNNGDEPIPVFARFGNTVKYSRAGKKLYLGSDTKVGIGRPNVEPTEPLALGNVLKTFLTNLTTRIDTLINSMGILQTTPAVICTAPGELGIVNPAWVTALAALDIQLQTDISTYLSTEATNILSQIAFTERGV
jgi:hypothetical protein